MCGIVGREWHCDPSEVFWRWAICKCWALMHVYFYSHNVTCEAPMASDSVLKELEAIYAHGNG